MQICVLNLHADLQFRGNLDFHANLCFFTSSREEAEFKWPVKLPVTNRNWVASFQAFPEKSEVVKARVRMCDGRLLSGTFSHLQSYVFKNLKVRIQIRGAIVIGPCSPSYL